jgi:hypothetical protein
MAPRACSLLKQLVQGRSTARSVSRSAVVLCRSGTCYIFPLLGAFLADSYWGRYVTIIIFSVVYLLVRTYCCAWRLRPLSTTPLAVTPSSVQERLSCFTAASYVC